MPSLKEKLHCKSSQSWAYFKLPEITLVVDKKTVYCESIKNVCTLYGQNYTAADGWTWGHTRSMCDAGGTSLERWIVNRGVGTDCSVERLIGLQLSYQTSSGIRETECSGF